MSAKTAHRDADNATREPGAATNVSDAQVELVELTLNENGMIRDCSRACGRLFGCVPSELMWRHISVLLPQLADIPLMLGEQINPRLRFLSHIGRQFEAVGMSGVRFVSEIFFTDIENLGRHYLHLVICPVGNATAAPG